MKRIFGKRSSQMIVGIGIDLIDFEQIHIENQALLKKILTQKEYNKLQELKHLKQKIDFFAGRFAAKEAYVKALGTGFVNIQFQDIEIINDTTGKPTLKDLRLTSLNHQIHLSISHSKKAATAVVILEQ